VVEQQADSPGVFFHTFTGYVGGIDMVVERQTVDRMLTEGRQTMICRAEDAPSPPPAVSVPRLKATHKASPRAIAAASLPDDVLEKPSRSGLPTLPASLDGDIIKPNTTDTVLGRYGLLELGLPVLIGGGMVTVLGGGREIRVSVHDLRLQGSRAQLDLGPYLLAPASGYHLSVPRGAFVRTSGKPVPGFWANFTTRGPQRGQQFVCTLGRPCVVSLAGVELDGIAHLAATSEENSNNCEELGAAEIPGMAPSTAVQGNAAVAEVDFGIATALPRSTYRVCWRGDGAAEEIGEIAFAGPIGDLVATCDVGTPCVVKVAGTGLGNTLFVSCHRNKETGEFHTAEIIDGAARFTELPAGALDLCWFDPATSLSQVRVGALIVSGPESIHNAVGGMLAPGAGEPFEAHFTGAALRGVLQLARSRELQTCRVDDGDLEAVNKKLASALEMPGWTSDGGSRKWRIPPLEAGEYDVCWRGTGTERRNTLVSTGLRFLVHETVCGDGVREGSEECDDGNSASRDGCDGCIVENGYDCRADAEGPDRCSPIGAAVVHSVSATGANAAAIFDRTDSTWTVPAGGAEAVLTLTRLLDLREVHLEVESPANVSLDISLDGIEWTSIKNVAAAGRVEFSVVPKLARFVRVTVLPTPTGVEVIELRLFGVKLRPRCSAALEEQCMDWNREPCAVGTYDMQCGPCAEGFEAAILMFIISG
jgi:cysteine-rich repeat protein